MNLHSFRAFLCIFLYQKDIKNLCVNASFLPENRLVYIHKAQGLIGQKDKEMKNSKIITIPEMRPLADEYFANGNTEITDLIALQEQYIQQGFWMHFIALQDASRTKVGA